jgi:hypothetical protein
MKIKEMIFEGTYVHKRVEAPVPTWDWAWRNHGYWDGPCVCADCILMGYGLVSPLDMLELNLPEHVRP